jgi:DNA-binding NarL/FixJ family response regulator
MDRHRVPPEEAVDDVTVRVLVADDQDLVRTGLRMILDSQPDIEVVGEAADGGQAVALARSLRPDVCLFDIRMPVMDGLEATRAVAGPAVADPIPVVVITTFDLDEYVYAALRAGARGFLLKDAGSVLLGEAVRAAARGDALIDPNVTVRLIEAFAGATSEPPPPPSSPLTDREEAVLAGVARGLGNSEIGDELHISLSTVKTHLESITGKLGTRNRVELAIWAHERGPRRG